MSIKNRDSFNQGFALAVAEITRSYDMPSAALGIMESAGISLADLIRSSVDEYDLKSIREAIDFVKGEK